MFYYVQEGINQTDIINSIKTNKPNNIYINSDTEWRYRVEKDFLNTLKEFTNVHFLFGSYNSPWYDENYNGVNLHFWNTFWFNWASMCLKNVINYSEVSYNNFTTPFICLNNKSNLLRCSIVDNLAKHNYIEKGNVTWNKFRDFKEGYKLKYYDDSFRGLDDDFLNKQDSFIIPKQWYTSLFHIVGESTNEVPFITEKTVIPILMKKPFIILGCQGFNQKLKDLGFDLFEDLINYNFDNEIDVVNRGSLLVENMHDIVNCSDLNLLYKKLLPKIEYNYHLALSIMRNIAYIPDLVRDRIDFCVKNRVQMGPVESRWQYFIQQTQ